MSLLQILVFIVTEIPEAVHIFNEILNLIHGIPGAREDLQTKVGCAIESGKTPEEIKAIITEKHESCMAGSVGCPADLIKE